MSNENEAEMEAEAAADFQAEKVAPRKRTDRAEARKAAQDPSTIAAARAFLEADAPKIEDPAKTPVEELPVPAEGARCGCGVELGHAVLGVHDGKVWRCPECFIRDGRSHDLHPVARAVSCNVCHRKSVDFAGRNRCPVCGAKGCTPLRAN